MFLCVSYKYGDLTWTGCEDLQTEFLFRGIGIFWYAWRLSVWNRGAGTGWRVSSSFFGLWPSFIKLDRQGSVAISKFSEGRHAGFAISLSFSFGETADESGSVRGNRRERKSAAESISLARRNEFKNELRLRLWWLIGVTNVPPLTLFPITRLLRADP